MKKNIALLLLCSSTLLFILGCASGENNDEKMEVKSNDSNVSREKQSDVSESENETTHTEQENGEEQYEITLYATDIKTKTFKMTESKTYTLKLFGEWSKNNVATLASKLREVPTDSNIILDTSKSIITSGLEFLYDFDNLTYMIGENLFHDFSFSFNLSSIQFKKIILSSEITEIPQYTFYTESFETPHLESITIPASVKKIGYQAFFGCKKLKEIIFEDSTESIELSYNKDGGPALFGEGLFYDCPLESVYIGRNLIYKKDGKYGFSPFEPRRKNTPMKKTIGKNVTKY